MYKAEISIQRGIFLHSEFCVSPFRLPMKNSNCKLLAVSNLSPPLLCGQTAFCMHDMSVWLLIQPTLICLEKTGSREAHADSILLPIPSHCSGPGTLSLRPLVCSSPYSAPFLLLLKWQPGGVLSLGFWSPFLLCPQSMSSGFIKGRICVLVPGYVEREE